MDFKPHFVLKFVALFTAINLPQAALAQSFSTDSLWDLSLTDLLEVKTSNIATGTQTPLDKSASTVTVINSAEIESMGATDLNQVLETVPGLHVGFSEQALNPKFNIRGITSTYNPQTLILINGIAITSLFVGNRSNVWAGMPVKSISRIEVIRGPGSAVYGADAFSGVINIITKNREEINGTLGGSRVASFDSQSAWLQTGASFRNTDLAFSLELETTAGWDNKLEHDAQSALDDPNQPVSLAPGSINTMKDMIESRLDIAHNNYRLRMGYQGRFNIGTGPGIAQALDDHGRFASNRFNLDLTYQQAQLTENWALEAQVSYYHGSQEVEENVHLFPKNSFGGAYPNGFIGNPEFKEHNVRINLTSLYRGFSQRLLRAGAGFYGGDIYQVTEFKNFNPDFSPKPTLEDVSDSDEAYLPEKGRKVIHGFIQDEWQIHSSLQLISGIRHDHYSDFGNTTNPRLALIWAASETITSKILYGRAFRAPSMAELYVISNPVILGNSKLRPETIDSLELALAYQGITGYSFNTNFYYQDINDYITFVSEGATAQAQNAGARTGYGAELEIHIQLLESLNLYMNYAYQHSQDKQTKKTIGEAPNHQTYLNVHWQGGQNWQVHSQFNWVGAQGRTEGDQRDALASHISGDITLSHSWLHNQAQAKFSVRNLMNSPIREASPGPGALPVAAIQNDIPMAGRTLYAELQYHF